MHDLTQGSIPKNILRMTGFMLVSMVFQTLYFLVDLYFVGRLGKEAVAGSGSSGRSCVPPAADASARGQGGSLNPLLLAAAPSAA